jgi:hypothetical protein
VVQTLDVRHAADLTPRNCNEGKKKN